MNIVVRSNKLLSMNDQTPPATKVKEFKDTKLQQVFAFSRWIGGTFICLGLVFGAANFGAHVDGPGYGYQGLGWIGAVLPNLLLPGAVLYFAALIVPKLCKVHVKPYRFSKTSRFLVIVISSLSAKPLLHISGERLCENFRESCANDQSRDSCAIGRNACMELSKITKSKEPLREN